MQLGCNWDAIGMQLGYRPDLPTYPYGPPVDPNRTNNLFALIRYRRDNGGARLKSGVRCAALRCACLSHAARKIRSAIGGERGRGESVARDMKDHFRIPWIIAG